MEKEERKNRLYAIAEMASMIHSKLYGIVWENQEGQEDHFDRLPKAEKIALVGVLSDSVNLMNSINNFNHWFNNEDGK